MLPGFELPAFAGRVASRAAIPRQLGMRWRTAAWLVTVTTWIIANPAAGHPGPAAEWLR